MSRDNKQVICSNCGSLNCTIERILLDGPKFRLVGMCHCYHCNTNWEEK